MSITMLKADTGIIPPTGTMLCCVIPDGVDPRTYQHSDNDLYWINPNQMKGGTPISVLTADQVRAVTELQKTLYAVDGIPLEQWLYNFSCNLNPNNEICIFARIAYVMLKEQPYRSSLGEQQLLYKALLCFSTIASQENAVGKLLSMMPEAKRLKNLERVVKRYMNSISI